MPIDPIDSGTGGANRHAHDLAAHAGLAGIHALAGPVRDRDGAEGRFDILREPERDLVRRGPHRVADPWLGPVERRMSLCGSGAKQRKHGGGDE